jgi:hypothetical protein
MRVNKTALSLIGFVKKHFTGHKNPGKPMVIHRRKKQMRYGETAPHLKTQNPIL